MTPTEYVGNIMELPGKTWNNENMDILRGTGRLNYEMPLNEIIYDFLCTEITFKSFHLLIMSLMATGNQILLTDILINGK